MVDVIENKDGTMSVELTVEEIHILLKYAIEKIIEEYIQQLKEEKNI